MTAPADLRPGDLVLYRPHARIRDFRQAWDDPSADVLGVVVDTAVRVEHDLGGPLERLEVYVAWPHAVFCHTHWDLELIERAPHQ